VFIGGETAGDLAVVFVEVSEGVVGGFFELVIAGEEVLEGGVFDGHGDVDAVGGVAVLAGVFVGEGGEFGGPVEAVSEDGLSDGEVVGIAGAVVEPEGDEGIFAGADASPFFCGPIGGRGFEEIEVSFKDGEGTWVAGGFVVLDEDFHGDSEGPAVLVFGWAEPAVGLGAVEHPFDPGFGFVDESLVVEDIGEGDEAVEVVGAAFPAFAGASFPGGVGSKVGPELIEVACEAIGLDGELVLEPACGSDGGEGEWDEGGGDKRGAVGGVVGVHGSGVLCGGDELEGRECGEGERERTHVRLLGVRREHISGDEAIVRQGGVGRPMEARGAVGPGGSRGRWIAVAGGCRSTLACGRRRGNVLCRLCGACWRRAGWPARDTRSRA